MTFLPISTFRHPKYYIYGPPGEIETSQVTSHASSILPVPMKDGPSLFQREGVWHLPRPVPHPCRVSPTGKCNATMTTPTLKPSPPWSLSHEWRDRPSTPSTNSDCSPLASPARGLVDLVGPSVPDPRQLSRSDSRDFGSVVSTEDFFVEGAKSVRPDIAGQRSPMSDTDHELGSNIRHNGGVSQPPPPCSEPSPDTVAYSEDEWLKYSTRFMDTAGQTQWKCLWRDSDGPGVCYYWGKKQLVKRHVEGSHLRIKRYQCHLCDGVSFTQRTMLTIHLSSAHQIKEEEKPCPVKGCDKLFVDPARLHRHKVEVHGYVPKAILRKKDIRGRIPDSDYFTSMQPVKK